MKQNSQELHQAYSEDFLGKHHSRNSQPSDTEDTATDSRRKKRRDEYNEGFILRGDCL